MKILKIAFIGSFFMFALISCIDDDAAQIIDTDSTTFEIISNSPEHNTLEQLLLDTGLDLILENGTFTIFAPTDDAFAQIDISSLSNEAITQILLNHVITGIAESTDLSNSYLSTNASETISGNENVLNMYVNVDDGITLNGISNVTTADVEASNGIIHFVDAVIPIPDVTSFVATDNTFSTLFTALTRDDQPDFIAILSSFDNPAPFTVFAPTDDAFNDLLTELDIASLEDIDAATLTSTLNTHVVPNENIREQDFTSGTITTSGSSFDVNASTLTITDQSGRNINIIITNIQAGNGIIHAVDAVILP